VFLTAKRPILILIKLLAVFGAFYCGISTVVAQTYILASPNSTLNTGGWALDSSNMTGFSAAITNPTYFGPSGTVHTTVSIDDLSAVNSTTLAGVNGFVAPWIPNTDASVPMVNAVTSAFRGGMDLVLFEDDSGHNPIGNSLLGSSYLSPANGTVSNGSAPFFSGPFGTATNVNTYGNFAQFDATTILASGGTIVGTNSAGQVTIAYWAKGAFAPGSGALLLFSDVDMVSNWNENPYTPTLNSNGILALNTMAWLTSGAQAIPEPSTYALMGLGSLVLLVRRRKTTRSAR
jgi:hypothetical protein